MEPGCKIACWQNENRIQGNFQYMLILMIPGKIPSYMQIWSDYK